MLNVAVSAVSGTSDACFIIVIKHVLAHNCQTNVF